MKSAILLIDLFFLLIPLLFLMGRSALTFRQLIFGAVPALVTTVIFTEMAVFWAGLKVISFNSAYLVDAYYRLLPLEYYLFIFSFIYMALAIYEWLNVKYPDNELQKYSLAISNGVLGICVAFLFFGYTKWYTVVIFGFLLLLLFFIEYKNLLRFMYRFYRTFLLCLLPFLGFYIFFSNSALNHNIAENTGYLVLNMPLESVFMLMGMLLLTVSVSEFIKSRTIK